MPDVEVTIGAIDDGFFSTIGQMQSEVDQLQDTSTYRANYSQLTSVNQTANTSANTFIQALEGLKAQQQSQQATFQAATARVAESNYNLPQASGRQEYRVGDLIPASHPTLQEFPELANLPVREDPHLGSRAAFGPNEEGEDQISMRSFNAMGSNRALLHELEHARQQAAGLEGDDLGGSVADMMGRPEIEAGFKQKIRDELLYPGDPQNERFQTLSKREYEAKQQSLEPDERVPYAEYKKSQAFKLDTEVEKQFYDRQYNQSESGWEGPESYEDYAREAYMNLPGEVQARKAENWKFPKNYRGAWNTSSNRRVVRKEDMPGDEEEQQDPDSPEYTTAYAEAFTTSRNKRGQFIAEPEPVPKPFDTPPVTQYRGPTAEDVERPLEQSNVEFEQAIEAVRERNRIAENLFKTEAERPPIQESTSTAPEGFKPRIFDYATGGGQGGPPEEPPTTNLYPDEPEPEPDPNKSRLIPRRQTPNILAPLPEGLGGPPKSPGLLDKATEAAKNNVKDVEDEATEATERHGRSITGLIGRLVLYRVAYEGVRLVMEGIENVINFQALETTFTNLTSDAKNASAQFTDLTQSAAKIGQNPDDWVKADLALQRTGVSAHDAATEIKLLGQYAAESHIPLSELAPAVEKLKLTSGSVQDMFTVLAPLGEQAEPLREQVRLYQQLTIEAQRQNEVIEHTNQLNNRDFENQQRRVSLAHEASEFAREQGLRTESLSHEAGERSYALQQRQVSATEGFTDKLDIDKDVFNRRLIGGDTQSFATNIDGVRLTPQAQFIARRQQSGEEQIEKEENLTFSEVRRLERGGQLSEKDLLSADTRRTEETHTAQETTRTVALQKEETSHIAEERAHTLAVQQQETDHIALVQKQQDDAYNRKYALVQRDLELQHQVLLEYIAQDGMLEKMNAEQATAQSFFSRLYQGARVQTAQDFANPPTNIYNAQRGGTDRPSDYQQSGDLGKAFSEWFSKAIDAINKQTALLDQSLAQ